MNEKYLVRFPANGKGKSQIVSILRQRSTKDASGTPGKTFGYLYKPDNELDVLLKEVYTHFFYHNALSQAFFPSLAGLENEVVSMTGDLLNGGGTTSGNITTGGTESILMAVKSARDRAAALHPEITCPEMVVPVSAHPAFDKAAHCLGLSLVRLPLREDYRADVEALERVVNENTIFIAASAPTYPHGVVDPVPEMAGFALRKGIWFHVDACLGGFMLPFVEQLGYPVPAFDFRLEGVTSLSADVHKYGYGAKGASVLLYKNNALRRNQFFVRSDWPGGLFGSVSLLGTKCGGAIAAAWTVINYLGATGYLEIARKTMEAVKYIQKGVREIEGMRVVSNPEMSIFAIASDRINMLQVAGLMTVKGWFIDCISEPAGLHINVSHQNLGAAEAFLRDLDDAVSSCGTSAPVKASGYAVDSMILDFLDRTYETGFLPHRAEE